MLQIIILYSFFHLLTALWAYFILRSIFKTFTYSWCVMDRTIGLTLSIIFGPVMCVVAYFFLILGTFDFPWNKEAKW